MNDVKITAIIKTEYKEIKEIYENNIQHACNIKIGDIFISHNNQIPEGFCPSAWSVLKEFVDALANDKEEIYKGWMKDKDTYMISCNDGFRPVSFLLEKIKL